MSRLADCFARAKEKKRAALIIYLTGQDPDDDTSRRLMLAAVEACGEPRARGEMK